MRIRLNKPIDIEQNVMQALGNKMPYEFSYGSPMVGAEQEHGVDALIAYICPQCGAELYDYWNEWSLFHGDCSESETKIVYEYEESLKAFILEKCLSVQNLKECPICSEVLSREKGFYLEVATKLNNEDYGLNFYALANNKLTKYNSYSKTYDNPLYSIYKFELNENSLFEFMKEQREEKEKQLAVDRTSNKISLFDTPSTVFISAEDRNGIKDTPEKLKEYIHNLIEMEVNIYSLTQRLTNLYFQEYEFKRQANAISSALFYEKREELAKIEEQISDCFAKIARYEVGEIGVQCPIPPAQPIYKKASLFNKKKILAENEEMQRIYQNDVRMYEDNLRAFETKKECLIAEVKSDVENLKNTLEQTKAEIKLSKQQAEKSPLASEIKTIAEKEIVEAETLLQKMFECRNGLYSYEIVFGKYRNVVALSTFYEYLMAGRCTTLEGATGAYNLYEEQVRADMIIGQLSQVIEKLDDIKDTQYMIYSELQTVNKQLEHLNKTMDTALVSIQKMEEDVANISANTDIITHNSAVTAYYSKLNAELTNSLGYMMAFK